MKQFLLIVSIFVFEGVALWGIGEKVGLRRHYDKFRSYPVAEKSAELKVGTIMLADNVDIKFDDVAIYNYSRELVK